MRADTSRYSYRVICWFCTLAIPSLALFAQTQASRPAGESVRDVGNQRQVFIDGRFLARTSGVELVVHRPVKTGERSIEVNQPWEDGIGSYSSVLESDGRYHMWYRTGEVMCYASSADGVHWKKPALGIVEFKGSRQNNIVLGLGAGGVPDAGEGGMVFEDPTAPPDQRYRMVIKRGEPPVIKPEDPPDVCVFSSPDGIHWKLTHEHVLTFTEPGGRQHLDSQNVIFWDDRIKKYVAYMRRNVRQGGPRFRTVARSESARLGGFDQAQEAAIVLAPDEHDARFGTPNCVDYYTNAAIKYPWGQDAYYMFPTVYFHYVAGALSEFPKQAPVNAGSLDTQFAASRDGVKWHRFDRQSFIGLGPVGAIDSREARAFYGLLPSRDGRELYLYYVGSDRLHGWPGPASQRDKEWERQADPKEVERERSRAERNRKLLTEAGLQPTQDATVISRVVLRRDGFVSVRAVYTGGEFTTEPLRFSGRELILNVDTSATGFLQCELLDESDRPVQGFALNDCDTIHTTNEINRSVSWKGKKDLSSLAGQSVRVRFVMRSADLYAFQFR